MFGRHQEPPASVYLLADHLDAILGAGEDLQRLHFAPAPEGTDQKADEISRRNQDLRSFIASVHLSELSIATHLRQARLRARDVARTDKRFASLIELFIGGTAAVTDGLAKLASPDGGSFDHGNDPMAYLRAAALIGEETGDLSHIAAIVPDDAMMIAGRIQLGPLLDLSSAFLNSLDVAYDLYARSNTETVRRDDTPTALEPEPQIVSEAQETEAETGDTPLDRPGSLASALAALDKKAK